MPRKTKVSREGVRRQRRAGRYAAQELQWEHSTLKRVRGCGRRVSAGADGVTVRLSGGPSGRVAGFGGLQTCGSTWACPVCSAKIAAERQAEVETAVRRWQERGGGVIFGTATMRHWQRHRLGDLWDALSSAWHEVTSGASWTRWQEGCGHGVPVERVVRRGARKGDVVVEERLPWLRTVECTVTPNGWHLHVHFLMFVDRPVTDATAEELSEPMWQAWRSGVKAAGLPAPVRRPGREGVGFQGGWDVQAVGPGELDAIGQYFTKAVYDGAQLAALEVARGDLKDGRGAGSRTPFGLLRSLVGHELVGDDGQRFAAVDADDLALWSEWEQASKGRRQLTWSQGLRQLVGLVPDERSDEEIAADEHGGADVLRIPCGSSGWSALWRRPGGRWQLLRELEDSGLVAAVRLLRSWHVAYSLAVPLERVPPDQLAQLLTG